MKHKYMYNTLIKVINPPFFLIVYLAVPFWGLCNLSLTPDFYCENMSHIFTYWCHTDKYCTFNLWMSYRNILKICTCWCYIGSYCRILPVVIQVQTQNFTCWCQTGTCRSGSRWPVGRCCSSTEWWNSCSMCYQGYGDLWAPGPRKKTKICQDHTSEVDLNDKYWKTCIIPLPVLVTLTTPTYEGNFLKMYKLNIQGGMLHQNFFSWKV